MPQGACTLLLSLTLTHAFAIWLEVAEHSTNTEMDWGAALTVLLLVGVVNIPARQRKSACGWFVATHNFLNAFIIKTALSSVKETCRPSSQAGDDWHFSWKWRAFRAFSGKYLGGGNLVRISGLCTVFIVCFLTDTIYTHQCFICFIIEHASGFVRNALSAYMLLITEALMLSILLLRHVLLLPLYLPFYRVTASMHYKNLLMKYIHCGIACLATCSMKEIMYIGSNHTGWRIQL